MLSMKALLGAYAARGDQSEANPLNLCEENAQLPDGESVCAKLRLLLRLRMYLS